MPGNFGRNGGSRSPRSRAGRWMRVLRGAALIAAGALIASLFSYGRGTDGLARTPSVVQAPAGTSGAPAPPGPPAGAQVPAEAEVTLTAESVSKAGIKTAQVRAVESKSDVRVPGVVTPNSYKEVKVVPIVGGIVIKVHVELGKPVRRGEPLATLFSNDLAETQAKYLSLTAMAEADKRKLQRVKQLVEIGAASRQEFEEITAVRESRVTEIEAARQRLFILGLSRAHVEGLKSPSQIVSHVTVPAPIDGVIINRTANLGQVVGMGQELFTVTDLSDVWVVADIYERDFEAVAVGSDASLTSPAYPGLSIRGRVTYIDPRVDPQTRTAKVRLEVPNPGGRLRLGMYMTVSFATPDGKKVLTVSRAAVQTIGERQVVYIPAKDGEGKFIQRMVQLGPLMGDFYAVLKGLVPGESVVTEGSFFLRAESLRAAPSGGDAGHSSH